MEGSVKFENNLKNNNELNVVVIQDQSEDLNNNVLINENINDEEVLEGKEEILNIDGKEEVDVIQNENNNV